MRRKRNLDGSDFVQGLVFGYLHQADATTEDLAQILGRREVDISASGLCQRFTQSAAALVERVMQELINEGMQAEQPAPAELLGRFDAVIVEDSSTITLPDKLKDIWKGCGGGQGQSEAGLKLHVRWDLKQGGLQGPLLQFGMAQRAGRLFSHPPELAGVFLGSGKWSGTRSGAHWAQGKSMARGKARWWWAKPPNCQPV